MLPNLTPTQENSIKILIHDELSRQTVVCSPNAIHLIADIDMDGDGVLYIIMLTDDINEVLPYTSTSIIIATLLDYGYGGQ